MIERRQQPCLALETGQPVAVAGDRRRQELDGNIALKAGITRAIDTAHPAGADQRLQS